MKESKYSEKEELVKAVSVLFLKYGLRSTSMDDVAARLNISKKSIYKYFENKTELVNSVMRFREAEIMRKWEQLASGKCDVLQLAYAKMKIFPKFFIESTKSNYYDIKKYYPELYAEFLQRRNENLNTQVADFVRRGSEQGLFRQVDNCGVMVMIFVKMLQVFSSPEHQDFNPYTVDDFVTGIFNLFIRSIATDKGIETWEKLLRDNPDEDTILNMFPCINTACDPGKI